MTEKIVYHLTKVEFLADLSTDELREIAPDFHWEEYHQGDDIIAQGQILDLFYVMVEGKVEVLDSQGSRHIRINIFGPGDSFGARSLITGEASPLTVRCLKDCKLLVVPAEQFSNMLSRWPKLYKKFIERLSSNLDYVHSGLWEARHKQFLQMLLQRTEYEKKFYGLWGSPSTTKKMEKKLAELKQSKGHLLLIGERGTGRQMAAWYLHKNKFAEGAPFVSVDGRDLEKQWGDHSLLEYAAGGTLIIKEINEMSPRFQLKMADVLRTQEHKCLVIGTLQEDPELLEQMLVPELREVFSERLKLKPLRERKRDISFLAQGILEKLAAQHNRKTPTLDPEVIKLLLSHNYRQGNVSELIQVIERAFFLTEDDVISLEHVFFGPTAKKIGGTFDLLKFSWIRKLLKKGTFVLWSQRITAVIFLSIIIAMFAAPQAATDIGLFALVWGLWWPALAIISPFLGRVWCTVCPFAYVMDIVQQKIHWHRPVPDVLKKYDFLAITFLFALIIWLEIIFQMRSNPTFTAILLTVILGSAVLTGIIFTRHAWCRHLCPLGGFVGMASIGAALEVRSDPAVCLNKCTTFDCYKGSAEIPGCPMSQYAPFVDNNLACKLCFNCLRNCKNESVKFNLRIPGREVWHLLRVNQGFTIFIGISLAVLLPINYFEPLRQLWPSGKWTLWFSLSYWGIAIAAGLLTWMSARPFQQKGASRRIKLFFSLIPAVIAGHIIYQLHFLPGADTILLGLGFITASGDIQAFNIPAVRVGQISAAIIGLALTAFTFLMVMLRSGGKSSDKHSRPAGKTGSDSQQKQA